MANKRAAIFLIWFCAGMLLALGILTITSGLAGCQQMDKAVHDVNTVATAARTILESPAGQLVPPNVGLYGSLVVTALMSGAAAYKQWRLTQMARTTKAIVRGVEASEKAPGESTENPSTVKAAIGSEMRKLGIYDAGKKLVDRLKAS